MAGISGLSASQEDPFRQARLDPEADPVPEPLSSPSPVFHALAPFMPFESAAFVFLKFLVLASPMETSVVVE